MDEDVVLKAENISKKFTRTLKRSLYYGALDVTRSMLGVPYRTDELRQGEFWALQDIDFELRKGESLGIIGLNGSGKSTLLRVLNGIFPPDKGSVKIRGRIGGLIAVGAGFHPHMTGRENIILNGAILGMSRKELKAKEKEIIEFADIGDFIDAPIATYSSGMKVRLGFAIAVHVEPETLLIDEVLAVGDESFKNKALRKLNELRKAAGAMLFISHSMDSVSVLCDRVIVLNQGKVHFSGSTQEGIESYYYLSWEKVVKNTEFKKDKMLLESKKVRMQPEIEYIDSGFINESGEKVNSFDFGKSIYCFYEIRSMEDVSCPAVSIGIRDDRMNLLVTSNARVSDETNEFKAYKPDFVMKKGKKYKFYVEFKNPSFSPGLYRLAVSVSNCETLEKYQMIDTTEMTIEDQNQSLDLMFTRGRMIPSGIHILNAQWKIEEQD